MIICFPLRFDICRCEDSRMPRKKKKKTFSAAKAVRELARDRVGAPKPGQLIPNKKKLKEQKHKPTMGKLLQDQES